MKCSKCGPNAEQTVQESDSHKSMSFLSIEGCMDAEGMTDPSPRRWARYHVQLYLSNNQLKIIIPIMASIHLFKSLKSV